MFSKIKVLAKKSKTALVAYKIYNNFRIARAYKSGIIESTHGSTNATKTVDESLEYIAVQFEDYMKYSGLASEEIFNKKIIELGFGDNFGVALRFLAAGAAKVICIDRFYSLRDPRHELKIYEGLRRQLSLQERQRFDEVIDLHPHLTVNKERLAYFNGSSLEQFVQNSPDERNRIDLIVSRAVIEEIYEPRPVFMAADWLLCDGGLVLHKIDLSDYGVFSENGMHPLTFLTIAEPIYRLMAKDSAIPNRKRISYYRTMMNDLGYEATLYVSSIIGVGHLSPYREQIAFNTDYGEASLQLVRNIRRRLKHPYHQLPNEDLIVDGIFLVGRKPNRQSRLV
jgi:hypothetical protein